ncbi:MAG: DegT/DnrJ/EryC1/StrS family aminotransferase [Syntrophotaleaceae bacterium]
MFDRLRSRGIMVNVHYIPVHTQPYYERLGFRAGDFPKAERYYQEALTLPLYFELTEQQQDRVINELLAAVA